MKLPKKCDHLFVMFPAKEGHAAFTHPETGSLFIQSLMATISSKDTCNDDLLTMVGVVKSESKKTVIDAITLKGRQAKAKQTNNHHSTLCPIKHIYFNDTYNLILPVRTVAESIMVPVKIEELD